jgi:calcium/calmodulin-dependent protein kinase I
MNDISDKYEIGEELGKGAFSIVKIGINKETGEKFAIKIINKKDAKADQDGQRLKTEIEILKKVKHPNIVCLKDIYETTDNLYLIMELVTGGELFDKIVEKGQYTEKEASVVVSKMLNAIDYLHQNNIVHRDLKPENILLQKGDDSEVKISDFGLSKIVGESSLMETACGTPYYVAPEVLSATGYGKSVDLWSIGVITYLLLCGFPPFYGENLPEVFEQILNAEFDFPEPYWTDVSDEAKDFIKKLLVLDSKKRYTAKQALEHPWIKNGGNNHILKLKGDKVEKYVSQRKLASQTKLKT